MFNLNVLFLTGHGNRRPTQDRGRVQVRVEDLLPRGGFLHGPHKDEGDCRGLPRSRCQGRRRHSPCSKLTFFSFLAIFSLV